MRNQKPLEGSETQYKIIAINENHCSTCHIDHNADIMMQYIQYIQYIIDPQIIKSFV
jgi:hypothetical protein